MHTVVVLAVDGVVPFDLFVPAQVFGRARLPSGGSPYRVLVAALDAEVHAGAVRLRVPHRLDVLAHADTVVVPHLTDAGRSPRRPLLAALRSAASAGARIVCLGAGVFVVAAAGLLDGRRATTHWSTAAELARRHPAVLVDSATLYVEDHPIFTCAGAAAGLDLCLRLIRRDHGAAVAATAACLSVMAAEREGSQPQVIPAEPPTTDGASMEPLLRWLQSNCERDLSLADIAAQAGLSTRTLSRRFRDQVGTTPMQWLHRVRVRRAQHLLETTAHSVEDIGAMVGFASSTTFRQRFRQVAGESPQAYRQQVRRRIGTDEPRRRASRSRWTGTPVP